MGLFSRFAKARYDDVRIVSVATRAIEEDPVVENPGKMVVTSNNGVVTLSGPVGTEMQARHIEGVVNGTLRTAGLKHAEIVNKLAFVS
jgi:osmotically-inducible protein OsmY